MSRLKTVAIEIVAPVLAFLGAYIAGTLALGIALAPLFGDRRMLLFAWASLGAAAVANLVCVAAFDRFRLRLGILEPPAAILGGFAKGSLVAIGLITGANLLILATTAFRHTAGPGIDWFEVFALFVPAAIHEELVFRGYLLQKPARLHLIASVALTSLLFALVHGGNPAVGTIALVNIVLAGVLLALAWVWRRNLWIPIGIHVVWNVFSGPVLGHEVSGLSLPKTLLRTVDPGPDLLTGGAFGIEASIYLTIAELAVIAFLIWRIRAVGALASLSEPVSEAAIAAPSDESELAPPPANNIETKAVNETEI
jgi:membrane protease YdiL (CAAX protease family)